MNRQSGLINAMRTNDTLTANGAVTNSTSLNPNLDLFFIAGACRNESVANIEAMLQSAYVTDRVLTLKTIFWAGDIRKGAGERRFFQIALEFLNKYYPKDLVAYLDKVPEFSRWDVLFEIDNPAILDYIAMQFRMGTNGLLFKWLPRKKQYDNFAAKLRAKTGLTPKQYRKYLVENTKVVEQQMCANQWGKINFEHVPSVASHNYIKAFYKHCNDRFTKFIEQVNKGEKKMNASAIFPHQILDKAINGYSATCLTNADIAQWNSLPNYMTKPNSILPICDVSGSMSGTPMAISVALGLYISERNQGIFKDAFMTFSSNPVLEYLKGDIKQRISQMKRANWQMSTDIQASFKLILQSAQRSNLPQDEFPETVLIISDMEFDSCGGRYTNMQAIQQMFVGTGYECPNLVFWNVNGRAGNMPVTVNDKGVACVSGASPVVLKSVLTNEISPVKIMLSTIATERYSFIK